MDIGETERTTVIEPLENPVPVEHPVEAPTEAPAEPVEVPERERELVPA